MTEKTEKKQEELRGPRRNRDLGQQMVGGIIGALAVAIAVQIGASLGWEPANRTSLVLVGATIGAILFNLDRFDKAGAGLTKRKDARALNVIVAVLGMLVVTAAVWGLVALIGWVWQQF